MKWEVADQPYKLEKPAPAEKALPGKVRRYIAQTGSARVGLIL